MSLRAILLVVSFCLGVFPSYADLYPTNKSAPNWCKFSKRFLIPVGGRKPLNCREPSNVPLCIKLNNYGCLWQRKNGWIGTDIKRQNNGAHDNKGQSQNEPINNGHSVFTHPKWSIAAKLKWFSDRSEGKNFLELAEIYLPWCDVQGSKKSKNGWYNSCDLKDTDRVAGRKYCDRPEDLKPTREQCDACNCPSEMAEKWSTETGLTMLDKPVLFDKRGKPTRLMLRLTLRNSVNELGGYQPNSRLLRQSIRAFLKTY